MGRGKTHSSLERAQVLGYRDSGKSVRQISVLTNIAKSVVQDWLTEFKRTGQLNVPDKRPSFAAKKTLAPRHKRARLSYAIKYQFWKCEWHSVIFSDEKLFHLDGPDYSTLEKRKFGDRSLMVWAAIGYEGKSPVCFVPHKFNSAGYLDVVDKVLVNCGDDIAGSGYIFQQDNARFHTSKKSMAFFASRVIPLLDHPAVSPDLNPMEDVWAHLFRGVYAGKRKYSTVQDLRDSINAEWLKLELSTIKKMIDSMPQRLKQVIKYDGALTDY
jgi:hypothetical protein